MCVCMKCLGQLFPLMRQLGPMINDTTTVYMYVCMYVCILMFHTLMKMPGQHWSMRHPSHYIILREL